jgi:replicative DNA helicase
MSTPLQPPSHKPADSDAESPPSADATWHDDAPFFDDSPSNFADEPPLSHDTEPLRSAPPFEDNDSFFADHAPTTAPEFAPQFAARTGSGSGRRGGAGRSHATREANALTATSPLQPANLLAERAVLGACLTDPDAVPLAMSAMQAEDFYDQRHVEIFQAITRLAMANANADVVAVHTDLEQTLKDKNPVPLPYLFELCREVGSSAAVEHYANGLTKLARARRILRATHLVQQKGYERGLDPDEFVQIVEKELGDALKDTVRGGPQPISQLVGETYQRVMEARARGGEIVGISTGFRDIDHWHLGLHATDLIILAARPAMGKSAFALNLAANVAEEPGRTPEQRRARVAFFSLEMGREQLVLRMLSSRSRIGLKELRTGQLSNDDERLLREAASELAELDLHIDDTPSLSTVDLRSRCKRLEMGGPLTLVVVDYLQLMRGTGGAKQSREQEVAEISRSLKALAKESHCTVVALSQLNRSLEKRDGNSKKPQMSDLRESGSIEQDADIIWFIHRENYYNSEAPEHLAQLVVAKQRAGMTGDINLHFEGKFTKFSTLDDRVNDQYANGG